jgi:phospholipid/cholesterol/gamma-HCH transport system ATP-binding protein
VPTDPQTTEQVIAVSKVSTRFGDHAVHTDLSLEVRRAEIFAVIGGSGSGKSTLLREMILLHTPDSGSIQVLGLDLATLGDADALALRQRWGVMFQQGTSKNLPHGRIASLTFRGGSR